ncbi:MAG: guanitoxin biosynthesis MATE family efflux transporter GntT [Cyanobacteria bacterium P01_E01_bin.42]
MNPTQLNSDNFLPRFSKLALTNTLSNIMIPLSGLVSVAFLGHLTEIRHLAGVAVATVLFTYLYRLLHFLRMGTTGITAQAVGRDDREALLLVGWRNGLIALVLGIAIVLLQYPLEKIWFFLLDAPEDVKTSGIAYFNARIWGAPAVALNLVAIGWLLGKEMSGKVLIMTIVGNVSNIIFDYFSIMQWGWGSMGAGLSACLSQYLTLSIGLFFIGQDVHFEEIQQLSDRFWQWSGFKTVFSVNRDTFIKILSNRASLVIFTNISAGIGTQVLAGNALIIELFLFTISFIEGFGLAAETLAGTFLGQEKSDRLPFLAVFSVSTGVFFALLFSGISNIFPETVFGILTNHFEVINELKKYAIWLIPLLVFNAIAFMFDGYFIGLSNTAIVRNSALLGLTIGFLPILIPAWLYGDNHILWLSLVAFMIVRTIYVSFEFIRATPNFGFLGLKTQDKV